MDFEITMPEVNWISQTESRALKEHTLYFKVAENAGDEDREAKITFTNKDSQLKEWITINQKCPKQAGYENGVVTMAKAGTMKELLGDDYLNITSLKVVGPINGDDVYYLRKMLGGDNFSEADWGKLTTLDLSEATIAEGGEYYYEIRTYGSSNKYYTSNNTIGYCMFYNCANLQNVTLPDSKVEMGEYVFANCGALTSVTIGDGITSIGRSAFSYCKALTSVTIGDGVTSIGVFAFYGCYALTSVTIGDGVTSIGSKAFSYCEALTSVYISNLAAWCKIDFKDFTSNPLYHSGKFYLKNKEINEIVIPEDVLKIGSYTFIHCKNITKVTLHKGVTSISSYAFCDCSELAECYSYATTPPELNGYSVFSRIKENATLYVPARCGAAYKSSKWGNYFKNIIEMD